MAAQHSAAHPPVLTAHNLTLTFGKGDAAVHALRGVSATIPQGQWSTIMGPSGSGKTTLLHCLAGLTVPDRGTVTLHGRDRSSTVTLSGLSNNARAKLRRTRIGVVFQEFNLVPVLNVRDNILLPARLAHHRIDSAWQKEVISHLGLSSASSTCLMSSPVASVNVSPSPAPSLLAPMSFWRTSPPAISTAPVAKPSWTSSAN